MKTQAPRRDAQGTRSLQTGEGFRFRDGLLYRHWQPKTREAAIYQLVLPAKCRETVLAIAHEIPLGGYLEKSLCLQRFYWPTLHQDVATYCRSCLACHLNSSRRTAKALLIPLSIIEEPFRRIAMDIIGPLQKR